jgi:cell shape-determining protein MreD
MRKLAVKAVPFASAIILLLLPLVLPLSVRPPLLLAPVFYYASNGDEAFDGIVGIVLLGVLFDLIEPTRFGLNAFLLLTFYFLARYQKLFTIDGAWTSFLAFSALSAATILLKYIIFFQLVSSELSAWMVLADWLMLVALYPLIYALLARIQDWRDR